MLALYQITKLYALIHFLLFGGGDGSVARWFDDLAVGSGSLRVVHKPHPPLFDHLLTH